MNQVNSRVQKHRDSLRRAGLRPLQIWVPDSRQAGFAEECKRQSRLITAAEQTDNDELEQALVDWDDWQA